MISTDLIKKILIFQKNEITEQQIYLKLSSVEKSEKNKKVLEDIAADEFRHYLQWKEYTQKAVKPGRLKIFFYYQISRILGVTFGIKLMESGEKSAQHIYAEIIKQLPETKNIFEDEDKHEKALLELLDEERLEYMGSIVLGLNDALVELTGALAGFTFALQNTRLIAVTGMITGFAAALSMAASEYLSTKSEKTTKNPLKASVYTGIAYIFTVILLILPYLLLQNLYICLAWTLSLAILVIAFFNYYVAVAKEECFKTRFMEMAGLSLSVAIISFFVGYLIRIFIGVDI